MSASSVAQELAQRELEQWAAATFPGVELFRAEHTKGAGGVSEELTGRWHGVYLAFEDWGRPPNGGLHAAVCLRCTCCKRFAPHFNHQAVSSITEFATAYPVDPPSEIELCFDCEWLHQAQDRAERAHSRFAKWRFACSHGKSVDQVLARHRRAA